MADMAEAKSTTVGKNEKKTATCILVLGMAGSGKTSFVQRLTAHLHAKQNPPYVINLDPAVASVPFPANIDIRDTVKYKEVMKQYKLGPNGAIVTSLNLFATKFDQVLRILEKRRDQCEYVVVDTPGQIEVFTWSASGQIITESVASLLPTVVVYVADVARCAAPLTFMSNMLYACSILYRTKLPFVVALNKTDIVDATFALDWIRDFESFQEALAQETSYTSDLARSLSLVLDEFYADLRAVPVSAVTGAGFPAFLEAVGEAARDYRSDYKPAYDAAMSAQLLRQHAPLVGGAGLTPDAQLRQMERLRRDLAVGEPGSSGAKPGVSGAEPGGSGSSAGKPVVRHVAAVSDPDAAFIGGGQMDEDDADGRVDDRENLAALEERSFGNFLEQRRQAQREKQAKQEPNT